MPLLSIPQATAADRDGAYLPPRVPGFDHTRAFLADPYRFIARQCGKLGSDIVEATLVLRPTTLMTGPAAAEIFHDPRRFCRPAGAAAANRHRQALLMRVLAPERVARLADHAAREWQRAVRGWRGTGERALYPTVQKLLMRAACAWAGVPLGDDEVEARTADFAALFDAAAAGPMDQLRARRARRRLQSWLGGAVDAARDGTLKLPFDSAAHAIARHRDEAGVPLPSHVAAAELLDLLRPMVAVSVWIVFAAHALHTHPRVRSALQDSDGPLALEVFVHELRRHYPFFPAVAATVRSDFEWRGLHFPAGRRTLLDLYGIGHDARIWAAPDAFRPERFLAGPPAGDSATVTLTMQAVDMLARRLRYKVPAQDLSLVWGRVPAVPHEGFRFSLC